MQTIQKILTHIQMAVGFSLCFVSILFFLSSFFVGVMLSPLLFFLFLLLFVLLMKFGSSITESTEERLKSLV
jgi:uncharacterized membrane protein YbhN (UPF0104 family)